MNTLLLMFAAVVVALVVCVAMLYSALKSERARGPWPVEAAAAPLAIREQAAVHERQVHGCVCELANLMDELALVVEHVARQARVELPVDEEREGSDEVLIEAWRGVVSGAESARRSYGRDEDPIAWRWVFASDEKNPASPQNGATEGWVERIEPRNPS